MQVTIKRHVTRVLASARYQFTRVCYATVLTIEPMFVVYAVLTNSEEDKEEEPTIKRPDRGLLKRSQGERSF